MKSVVAGCGLALTIAAASFALANSSHAAPASKPILLAQADAPAAPAADAPAAPAADAPAAPAAAAPAAAGGVDAFGMPLGGDHDLTVAKCSNCHDVTEFSGQRHNADQWGEIIGSMIGRGADINDADFAKIQTYLATNLGSPPAP